MEESGFFHTPHFQKEWRCKSHKASHRGMNPEHLALAKQELFTLLLEGLIEPTYINK